MALSPEEAGPLIAVKMSAGAAGRLAKACQRMESRAWQAAQDARTEAGRARAMETYEWISWGASWMRNQEAWMELDAAETPRTLSAAEQTGDPR